MGTEERGRITRDAVDHAPSFIGSQVSVLAVNAPVVRPSGRLPWLPNGSSVDYRIHAAASSIFRRFRTAVEEEADFGHGFVLISVLLALGSLVWFALPYDVGIAKLAPLLCVFGISALLCRGRFAPWRPLAVAPFIFVGGMLLAAVETARLDTVILDGPVTTNLRGTILSREQDDRGRWRYLVEVDETSRPRLRRPPHKATLLARSRHEGFPVGASIEGKARLSPPSGPALPDLNDFAFDAFFKGVGAVGFFYGSPRQAPGAAESRADTSLFAQGKALLAAARETVGARIRETVGGDTGAIAAALITAEERAISRETVETLRAAGLSHVLAISGLNMVLAAGTFLVGARTLLSLVPGFAERLPVKKIAAAGALVMVLLYILISGGAVSALRSWIMISIMLVAVFFDRVPISLRNVALAGIIIIVWTPSAVAGPGFQMSFAATLALVAGYARWREYRMREQERVAGRHRWELASNFAIGSVATSLIGGLATAVYAAAYFHRLPAYGLIANVLATPLISILIMPFGLFAMLLMPFGLEHYPLVVMGQGLDWVLAVARYVASFNGEWVTGRVGTGGFVLAAFGGIILCVLRTRLALAGAVLIVFGGAAIALEQRAQRPSVTISEDGQLVGLITEDAIATNRTRPPDFIFSQWQRALPAANHVAPTIEGAPASVAKSEPRDRQAGTARVAEVLSSAETGGFVCRKGEWCVGRSQEGWTIIIVEEPELFPVLCEAADLVIAATRRQLPTCKSSRALIVTAETLRGSGAIEIYADRTQSAAPPRMRIAKSFTSTERPWQRHRRYNWRSNDFSTEEGTF
ncbi:ComEC/Rec2 family competence protein [Sinorhizobium sp. 8-89]|uniref:ComEC/Rec2 family competence protein n=1 Tax=Sinorhizobium sp. 7-81 TaxID=3049087 RepID=UPI0024C254ED|nr:ComEC/Rec2 family competence protein [Sinorhizobium sp. 7-81]MDK1388136.1 ComEC/Rec2 family competence protein [Sinorhizobium sp. 7-81]